MSNREIEMRTKENDKEAQVGRRGQVQKAVPRKKDRDVTHLYHRDLPNTRPDYLLEQHSR